MAARLLAVKQVTSNQGGETPGIDGITWQTDEAKMAAVIALGAKHSTYKASPVKRVLIPKGNTGKMRPLAIPTMFDRGMQALYNLALQPIAEVTGDSNSFGFRVGRSAHDAAQALYDSIKSPTAPKLIFDADIKGFFDNISHDWIMANIPLNNHVLNEFLKAGFIHEFSFNETEFGVPQGGIISPTIANMVLDGLERTVSNSLVRAKVMLASRVRVIRYADDFVIVATHQWILDSVVIPAVKKFLAERGLALNVDKTKIVN